MRHWLKAKAARFAAAALLIAGGGLLWLAGGAPVRAYSGAQAEAQMDPVWDPYGFPNIELCCQHKKYQKKSDKRSGGSDEEKRRAGPVLHVRCDASRQWRWDSDTRSRDRDDGASDDDDDDSGDDRGSRRWSRRGDRDSDRGGDRDSDRRGDRRSRDRSYTSIADALEKAKDGDTIEVFPGAPCDITGLVVRRSVTIASEDYVYGVRAQLVSRDSCAVVSPYGYATVMFRSIDIEGCLTQESGRLALNEVNLAWRRGRDGGSQWGGRGAVTLNGGSLTITGSTVRSYGTALAASRGQNVVVNGGRFASGSGADQVIQISTDQATVRDALVLGGKAGVRIRGSGLGPVRLTNVNVQSGRERGEVGIDVLGGGGDDDLPSFSDMPTASLSIEGGSIKGYGTGLVFRSGTRAAAKGVTIAGAGTGISVGAGAEVDLRENRLVAVGDGIILEGGARGNASFNEIECKGDCVCYAGDCTSRRDRDFAGGLFRMSGTRCRD